ASSGYPIPSSPSLSTVSGGTRAATDGRARIAFVREKTMMGISNEASISIPANNLLKITSPSSNADYDGWIPIAKETLTPGDIVQQIAPTAPIAFGTDWTEPVGHMIGTGTEYRRITGPDLQRGLHSWNLLFSTAYVMYLSYSKVDSIVEAPGGTFTGPDGQASSRAGRDKFQPMGRIDITTAASGGSGSGSGGGGGGGGCFTAAARVRTKERGLVRICDVRSIEQWGNRADVVETMPGNWGLVAKVLRHRFNGKMVKLGPGVYVTEPHCFAVGGDWTPAALLSKERRWFTGTTYNLEIMGENSCYMLKDGRVAHNVLK
ncbi:hypothetical protein LCGC14_3102850, partial [marine sediment metagenome]